MAEIRIGNSYSQILGLTSEQFRRAKKTLSYTMNPQAVYFSGAYKAHRRYLIDAKGYFPTGLLDRLLNSLDIKPIIKDLRVKPTKTVYHIPELEKWHEPYLDQANAAISAITNQRGGIIMPTGTGKSFVIAHIVRTLQVKTLIVVPTLELKRQLTETLTELFAYTKNITVANISSVPKGKYDCLIIDECHHSAAKTYQKLNRKEWNNIYYRFFLTATYFRNQTNEHLLFEGICGKPIFKLSYKDSISKKYIVPVEAYYYDVPPKKTNAHLYTLVYSDLVVNNNARNELIANCLNNLHELELPTLCLVKEIAHGEELSRLTGLPFVHGEDDESRKYIHQFNSGKIKTLIGTTGVLGEGVDTKPAEYIVITGLGKAKSAFLQQVGRGVRTYAGKESCKIILFKDESHKFMSRHFKEQCKILKDEFGIVAQRLD